MDIAQIPAQNHGDGNMPMIFSTFNFFSNFDALPTDGAFILLLTCRL